jgi:hypothetical protein
MSKEAKEKQSAGIYFTLGSRRAMWSSFDGSIGLSIFPNDKGKARTTGFVALDDAVNYDLVMNSIRTGELRKLDGPPLHSEVKVEMVDVTNRQDNNFKAMDQATKLVKLGAEQALKAIEQIGDPEIISHAITLESSGKNSVRKKRETILAALKSRLEKVRVMTTYTESDGKIDATVDENGLARGTVFEPTVKDN